MLKKNQSILLIDYETNRGLLLKWNLNRNLSSCFFRHILIFDVDDNFDHKSFSFKYFQKTKLGDMITFGFMNEALQYLLMKWKEKSPITQLDSFKLLPNIMSLKTLSQLFQNILERTIDFDQPVILNIITLKQNQQLKKIYNFVKEKISKREKIFVNIFAKTQTSLEPTTGINWFNIEDFNIQTEDGWNFLKSHYSQIALQKIKIQISCENGFFASKKQDQWNTVEFNKISREVRFPSINYTQDTIEFINQDSFSQINYVLNIKLEFTQLNNHVYSAFKKISIKALAEKVYQKTYDCRQIQYSTQVQPGFFSKKNPFKSQSLVWFKKNIQT